jgi:hypothetical protein
MSNTWGVTNFALAELATRVRAGYIALYWGQNINEGMLA